MKTYLSPEAYLNVEGMPKRGYLFVYATASVWTSEDIGHGDTSRKGWVSSVDQPDEPVENRGDVQAIFAASLPLSEDQADDLRRVLEGLGAVYPDGNQNDTLYVVDSRDYDLTKDEVWNYAVHSFAKDYDRRKGEWAETPVALLK